MKGYVHLYTGEGKGKTTAALGLALRAAGAGLKVYIAQFVKGKPYSEMETLKAHYPLIQIAQYGRGCFIIREPTQEDIDAARHGFLEVSAKINQGEYDLIILDEVCIALYYNLFSLEELLEVIKSRPDNLELILTGRYAPAALIDAADLVTEMKEVKHYYKRGVEARRGIEY